MSPKRLKCTILNLSLPGRVSGRNMADCLEAAFDLHLSNGSVSAFLHEAGQRAGATLEPVDLSGLGAVSLSRDEIFAGHQPNLLLVEPRTLTIVGLQAARPGMLPHFSGTLRYTTTLSVVPGDAALPALLDLGEVYQITEVTINGRPLSARICPPYRFEVTGLLREGTNELQIDVTNTLAKAWGSQNPFDRSMPQEPSGLVGPVRLLL